MKSQLAPAYRHPVKFRMPTAENLVPIRLDIEIDGQRYKDAFTWNPSVSASNYRRLSSIFFDLITLAELQSSSVNLCRQSVHLRIELGIISVKHGGTAEGTNESWLGWIAVVSRLGGGGFGSRWFRVWVAVVSGLGLDGGGVGRSYPDSEVAVFAKKTVKDLKLPTGFITQIAQSIQSQLTEFRSYEGQDMIVGEKIVPIKLDLRVNQTLIRDQFLWDLNNMESDPEDFAKIFCADMGIDDPEVGPAIAFSIREQLYEIAVQNVTSAKEIRVSKKGRRGIEYMPVSKAGVTAVDLAKLFGSKSSVIR
uniref:Bushy growth protein n=1 Tax=Chenopodium quinoa TaxID=63459 RepID=A0A803M5E3_CHEQI